MGALSRIGTLNTGRKYVWRGAADSTWRLNSSLIRDMNDGVDFNGVSELQVREREMNMLRATRAWGIERDLGPLATDLHLLSVLQHHGVPTRLLDVTSNPMTALWFACQQSPEAPNNSGVIFAFDITTAPMYSTIDDADPESFGAFQTPRAWTLRRALAVSARDSSPFIVSPALPDRRMQAQEGLFFASAVPKWRQPSGINGMFTSASNPVGKEVFESFLENNRRRGRPPSIPFCAIVIPKPVKDRMIAHLNGTYNRTESVLFPDIDGFQVALKGNRVSTLDEPRKVINPYDDAEAAPPKP